MNIPAIDALGVEWSASYQDLASHQEQRPCPKFEGRAISEVFDLSGATANWRQGGWEFDLMGVAGAAGSVEMEGRRFSLHFRCASGCWLSGRGGVWIGRGCCSVPRWCLAWCCMLLVLELHFQIYPPFQIKPHHTNVRPSTQQTKPTQALPLRRPGRRAARHRHPLLCIALLRRLRALPLLRAH